MKNKFSKKNILIFGVTLILVIIILAGLEKAQITDFYKKPGKRNQQSGQQAATEGSNDRKIDYSPATKQNNEAINQQKESDPKSSSQETQNTNSTLQIVLNRTYLDAGQVKVRSTVYGATSGSCKATLTKKPDGTTYTSPSVAIIRPTADYACSPININTSSLSPGTWSVSVMLESGGKTAQSQAQEVAVP